MKRVARPADEIIEPGKPTRELKVHFKTTAANFRKLGVFRACTPSIRNSPLDVRDIARVTCRRCLQTRYCKNA